MTDLFSTFRKLLLSLAQQLTVDLAGRGQRELIDERHLAWVLERREPLFDVLLDAHPQHV